MIESFCTFLLWLKESENESCLVASDSLWPHRLYSPWNFPGQNTGVGSLSLFQAIFPTQESNPGLPHGRWILYQLSYKGSPKTLEWISYPFSRESSRPRSQTESMSPISVSNQCLLHCRWILWHWAMRADQWNISRLYFPGFGDIQWRSKDWFIQGFFIGWWECSGIRYWW